MSKSKKIVGFMQGMIGNGDTMSTILKKEVKSPANSSSVIMLSLVSITMLVLLVKIVHLDALSNIQTIRSFSAAFTNFGVSEDVASSAGWFFQLFSVAAAILLTVIVRKGMQPAGIISVSVAALAMVVIDVIGEIEAHTTLVSQFMSGGIGFIDMVTDPGFSVALILSVFVFSIGSDFSVPIFAVAAFITTPYAIVYVWKELQDVVETVRSGFESSGSSPRPRQTPPPRQSPSPSQLRSQRPKPKPSFTSRAPQTHTSSPPPEPPPMRAEAD